MNNNTGTYQIHPLLLQLLQGQGQQVAQNANDILNGTGVGQQLQGREAYLNNANSHMQNTLNNLLTNNPGGYVTNAAGLQGNQNNSVATDNSMTLNALLGIIGQATGLQNNAVQTMGSVNNNLNDTGVNAFNAQTGRLNANVNAANSGWTTDASGNIVNNSSSGGGSGNPRVDTWTQAILNGQSGVNNVPADIKPMVLKQLTKQGYDVARPVNSDIADLVNLYGVNGNSIGSGNNPGQSVKNSLGDLLSFISGNHIQTATEQRMQQYKDAAANFKKKYQGVFGGNIDLPSSNDTAQVAQNKFTRLMKQVRNVYYNGTNGPSQRPSLDQFNR